MARPEKEKDRRTDTNSGLEKKGIIGKIFGPVGKMFGWVAKGSSGQPLCQT
jgi:hypothetical protein